MTIPSGHVVTTTVETTMRTSYASLADYVATCSCGWQHREPMGQGKLGDFRRAIDRHVRPAP